VEFPSSHYDLRTFKSCARIFGGHHGTGKTNPANHGNTQNTNPNSQSNTRQGIQVQDGMTCHPTTDNGNNANSSAGQ